MLLTFEEYLTENTINAKLRKEFGDSVRFNVQENDSRIILSILVVPYKERNKGIGSKFMRSLIKYAKEANKNIYLTPDDSYAEPEDMNKAQLTKWYKSFGFQKKKKDDFSTQAVLAYYVNDEY